MFYFGRGMLYAPKQSRLLSGIVHVSNRAPLMGGTFALWAGTYALIDYSIFKATKTSTHLNPIISGFLTGGLLSWRCKNILLL